MAGSTALEIGANIATPLALIGVVGALVFLTIQQLLKSGTLPNPPPRLQRLIDRILIFSFAIMLLGVLSAYLLREREVSYRGVVRDSVSNSVISGADVSIEGHSELFPANTDDNGTFAIQGNIRASSLLVTVVVRKDGYRTLRENRTIEISSPVDSIKLVKGRDAAVAATNPASAASAASAPVAAASAPVYETRWERADQNGQPFSQSFPVTTQNRHGRSDIIASGSFTLGAPDSRIYTVQYACAGYPCGWSYNPNGGYGPSVLISPDGHSFQWFRRWDGDPAQETYTALYEVARRVCVSHCPQ